MDENKKSEIWRCYWHFGLLLQKLPSQHINHDNKHQEAVCCFCMFPASRDASLFPAGHTHHADMLTLVNK